MPFRENMKKCLDTICVPFYDILHGNQICNCTDHLFLIEKYFTDIVSAIEKADKCLPRSRPGLSKSFWNDELTSLKKSSRNSRYSRNLKNLGKLRKSLKIRLN